MNSKKMPRDFISEVSDSSDRFLELAAKHVIQKFANRMAEQEEGVFSSTNSAEIISHLDTCSFIDNEAVRRKAIGLACLLCDISIDLDNETLTKIFARLGIYPTATMLEGYAKDTESFSGFSSIFSTINASINKRKHELNIAGKRFSLTSFQHDVLNAFLKNRVTGISAPTSSGKSYALYLCILHAIHKLNYKRIAYVVPTISLINQVSADLKEHLAHRDMKSVTIRQTALSKKAVDSPRIEVLTQERFLSGLADESTYAYDMVIIDEVQNIEKATFEDGDRAKTLLDSLFDLSETKSWKKIMYSGPMIANISEIGANIFGDENIGWIEAKESPVFSATITIQKGDIADVYRLYSELLPNGFVSYRLPLSQHRSAKQSKVWTTNDELSLLDSMEHTGMIAFFCESPSAAQRMSTLRAGQGEHEKNQINESFSNYIRETVSPDYPLADSISNGIAYHTGKIPQHIRIGLEYLLGQGAIKEVYCTTTLLQGVNLPIKHMIMRSPKIILSNNQHQKLSKYEVANLRGRAGRLLKDFAGYAVVLDHDSFMIEGEKENDIFSMSDKTLDTSLIHQFLENRRSIIRACISETESPDHSISQFVRRIRGEVYRFEEDALPSLAKKGIALTQLEFNDISSIMSSVSLDKAFVKKYRYWDPLILQKIKTAIAAGMIEVPHSIFDHNIVNDLIRVLDMMNLIAPTFTSEKLRIATSGFFYKICKNAVSWARETPLKTIILENTNRKSKPDTINGVIDLISSKISHSLPQLISPAFELAGYSGVPGMIEIGACSSEVMGVIGLGISRETAIRVAGSERHNINCESEETLIESLKQAAKTLNYWDSIQINRILV